MTAWQYFYATDGAPNWSSQVDATDSGGAGTGDLDGDGIPGVETAAGIPILLNFVRNNPARVRTVAAINGRSSWFGG